MSFFTLNKLKSYLPFLEWIPELKDKKVLRADIFAWITVAVILIPQAMAYASLAWLPPYIWLYTAFLPVMIWGLFSSSRQLSTWPVTVISLMTATALAPFALDMEQYIMYAAILAIMMWVMQLTLWFLKLWSIFNFLSHSVIVWFINAAAILIWFSQLKWIFWVDIPSWLPFYQWIIELYNAVINSTNIYVFIFWISWIFSLYILHKFFPKIPRFLIVVIISIIISYLVWFEQLWWKVIWEIPAWLPSLYIPNINLEILKQLLPAALIVWFLWFTEAISIAKSIGLETKKSVSTNQMLISEWLANLASGFSKWYPVSGTFARSAVNLKAWAVTPFASIVTWIIIWIVLLFFTPYLYHLPSAILSAIIIIAVVWLIKTEPIIKSWKIQKTDAIVSIITFFVTLIYSPHLEVWIFTWVFLSLIFHLYKSMKPRFSELSMAKDWAYRDAELHWLVTSKKVWVYRFYWKLFFVNIRYFEWKLMKYIESNPDMKVVIIDFDMINYIDSSAMEVLENIIISMKNYNIEVYFVWIHANLWKQFTATWYLEEFWKHNVFPKIKDIIEHLHKNKRRLDLKPLLKYMPIKKNDK